MCDRLGFRRGTERIWGIVPGLGWSGGGVGEGDIGDALSRKDAVWFDVLVVLLDGVVEAQDGDEVLE